MIREWINNKRRDKYIRESRMLLNKEGINSLKAFMEVGRELNIDFTVMFGSLLGAYRDHDFISHDDDIDMTCDIKCLSAELLSKLREHGFVIDEIYVASDGVGVQLPMKFNGLTSDIYFLYDSSDGNKHIILPLALEGKDWSYSAGLNIFSAKDISLPISDERTQCIIRDFEINIPSNTNDILKALYGENYMTPIEGAHANPPVRYYGLGEKYYTCFPIVLFEESGMISKIKHEIVNE